MKKNLILALVMLVIFVPLSINFYGCKKDNPPPDNNENIVNDDENENNNNNEDIVIEEPEPDKIIVSLSKNITEFSDEEATLLLSGVAKSIENSFDENTFNLTLNFNVDLNAEFSNTLASFLTIAKIRYKNDARFKAIYGYFSNYLNIYTKNFNISVKISYDTVEEIIFANVTILTDKNTIGFTLFENDGKIYFAENSVLGTVNKNSCVCLSENFDILSSVKTFLTLISTYASYPENYLNTEVENNYENHYVNYVVNLFNDIKTKISNNELTLEVEKGQTEETHRDTLSFILKDGEEESKITLFYTNENIVSLKLKSTKIVGYAINLFDYLTHSNQENVEEQDEENGLEESSDAKMDGVITTIRNVFELLKNSKVVVDIEPQKTFDNEFYSSLILANETTISPTNEEHEFLLNFNFEDDENTLTTYVSLLNKYPFPYILLYKNYVDFIENLTDK